MINPDQEIAEISLTKNKKKKLINLHNAKVTNEISIIKGKIRDLRAIGTSEQNLRFWYAELSKKEDEII